MQPPAVEERDVNRERQEELRARMVRGDDEARDALLDFYHGLDSEELIRLSRFR
jgi:hypothetical protein